MIYFYLLCFALPLTSSQETSQGVLSNSLSELGSEISEFSSQTADSLTSLNTKLEAEQEFSSDASESLISSRISELEIELSGIDTALSMLTQALAQAEPKCGEKLDCDSCTISESCVWCTIEKRCVNGDSLGPINGECSDFLYESCSYAGCNEYLKCEICISDTTCGWCSIGHVCYSATSTLKGDCEFQYFYHAEGNTECPPFTRITEKTSYNSDEVLQQEIDELLFTKEDINNEIEDLNDIREEIVKESSKVVTIPEGIQIHDYEGIGEVTDSQANTEAENRLEFQEELWLDWANSTSMDLDEMIYDEYDDIIEALEVYQNEDEVELA